ncbi:MAG: hypothetical protein K2O29_11280, partial [Ruminococcus sp.]|nr:hypothetical protein [Ruminococcus sp.]
MANTNNYSKSKRNFTIASVMLFVIMVINMINSTIVFLNGRRIYDHNMNSLQRMSTICEQLLSVNREVLMIVSDTGNPMANVNNIHNSFNIIRENMQEYEEIDHSDMEKRRYNHAKLLVESYDNKLLNLEHSFAGLDSEQMKNIYLQEIHPT